MSWKNIIKEDLPLYTKRVYTKDRKDLEFGKAIYAIGYIFNNNRDKVFVYNGGGMGVPFVLAEDMK
tara:strand:+ start:117 stop:314 length:198 start_codon:yes stop_codon:yes gene_type:complete